MKKLLVVLGSALLLYLLVKGLTEFLKDYRGRQHVLQEAPQDTNNGR